MKTFITKSPFKFGYGNGYVLLSKNDYEKIDIAKLHVHRGITYNEKMENCMVKIPNKFIGKFDFCIGFDTNFYGDNIKNCSKQYLKNETEKLLKQCQDFM